MPKARPTPRANAGSIYAIGAVGSPLVKIGSTTTSIEQRLKTLQTGQPMALHIVARQAVEADLQRIERQIHAFLAGERQRGEWFALKLDADELAALIHRAVEYLADKDEQAQRAKDERPARSVKRQRERRGDNEVGQCITAQRQAQGRSLTDVARAFGVSVSTMSRYESGKLSVPLLRFHELATVFKTTLKELFPFLYDIPSERRSP
jgi:DNA-binding XRE family transcriptional regulator